MIAKNEKLLSEQNRAIGEHQEKEVGVRGGGNRKGITLSSCVGALLVLAAFYNVGGPLADNSFFTHLATGRYILQEHLIPTTDIYSFAGEGTKWVVQSWFPSTLYATIEEISGGFGIRLFVGLMAATIVFILWSEASKLGLLMRTIVVGIVAMLGVGVWNARPATVATLLFVLVFLTVRKKVPVWSAFPVGLLWVISHGSWPLGIAVLTLLWVGACVDAKKLSFNHEFYTLTLFAAGVVTGAMSSLGVDLLTFPTATIHRSDVLSQITEWGRTGAFSTMALTFLWPPIALSAISLARKGGVGRYLLFAFAVLLGFSAFRNVTFANIIFFFLAVDGLEGIGRDIGKKRRPVWLLATAAMFVYFMFLFAANPNWNYESYPVAEVEALEEAELIGKSKIRVAGNITASNYMSLLYGTDHKIFVDDRFDMFEKEVIWDALALNDGYDAEEALAILNKYDIDIVVSPGYDLLTQTLSGLPQWAPIVAGSGDWFIFCDTESLVNTCGKLASIAENRNA